MRHNPLAALVVAGVALGLLCYFAAPHLRAAVQSRTDTGVPGAGDDLVTTVTNKTVYVDLSC